MPSFKERLADILVSQELVSKDNMDALLEDCARDGKNFAHFLIEKEVVSEGKLTEFMSKEFGLPLISVSKYRIDPLVSSMIPERMARQYNVIALSKFGDNLMVAMSDPLNVFAIDDLKALIQIEINPVLSPESEIRQAIDRAYLEEGDEMESLEDGEDLEGDAAKSVSDVLLDKDDEDEAPVVRAINLVVAEGIRRSASDIHIEPVEDSLRVRYRIDGQRIEAHKLPRSKQGSLVARLKIMSGLDITEWRLPQDGRFKARLAGKEVDFRVSVLPVAHGGKVVLRILDKDSLNIGLENLGFLPESIELFNEAVARPYGMILVTGPTGSGKSTTLYSVLSKLNESTRNLMNIEDPVEYQVDGIVQVQANPNVGLTFSNGLRALLRQSPDIVMIGEIRDFETADIAMKSSLTGQLVLSTLHTNDAPSAVTRLVDMGVEPFLVASSVNLIEAQRLIRKLCAKCREPEKPSDEILERLKFQPKKGDTYYRANGCRLCGGNGYKGRMGIIEVCLVDDQIRELIVSRAQSWEIKDYAVKKLGMIPLRDDGLRKAAMGITTLDEVLKATTEE